MGLRLDASATPLIGLTGAAVAAIVGAYVVLYPNSRILLLMPVPLDAHEVPAMFFVGLFFVLHVAGGASGRGTGGSRLRSRRSRMSRVEATDGVVTSDSHRETGEFRDEGFPSQCP